MDKYEKIARGNGSIEATLELLHDAGASPIDALKALRTGRSLPLGERKEALSRSPAWETETKAADQLHQKIIDAFEEEGVL